MSNPEYKQKNVAGSIGLIKSDNRIKNAKPKKTQYKIYWHTVIFLFLSHLGALYGIYLGFTNDVKYRTLLFGFFLHQYGLFSVFAGAHRLWAHRAYKATWQLKCILLFGQTQAFQVAISVLLGYHANIMLFSSHLPVLIWDETWKNAIFINIARHILLLHVTWLVNSAAHLWGSKPYDKNIKPANNPIVSFFAAGEGWHNYHHTFPWDYRASEFGNINLTLTILNFFVKIGWAYDLKTASIEMIKNREDRTGDGSHEIWGWGDQDQTLKSQESAVIYYKKK